MFPTLQFVAKPPCLCTKAPGTGTLASPDTLNLQQK